MGVVHGAWCVGCCWGLMAALFALGGMSLTWMVAIAGLIAVEKLLRWRHLATRLVALTLVALALGVSLAPREVELLRDLGQREQSGGSSFKQGGYAWMSRFSCLRIHEEGPAKITPPTGSELAHKRGTTPGLSAYQARAKISRGECIRTL